MQNYIGCAQYLCKNEKEELHLETQKCSIVASTSQKMHPLSLELLSIGIYNIHKI